MSPASEIVVQYFAAARELAGVEEERVRVPSASLEARQVWALLAEAHPKLAPFAARMRLAVNDELVELDALVHAGDRVAVLPPVAGGAGEAAGTDANVTCALRDTPLSLDEAMRLVAHPSAGGIAMFVGVVRDHADGKPVARLDYESHAALAQKQLQRVAAEVVAAHPGTRLCALHRVGSLRVGDLAVIVATSAAHREQAFVTCRLAIERIKAEVAIWKKEWDTEGAAHWVNLEPKR
ncbi:MAG TPA: molybdenum cofactor biosynthesis protein MoaE [Polyangiales bacterium]|jgi:molybdopterin synthase catalytic subunit|nr:molybdenum cofactor biosynthesis protein MoaE [Polyangiales bacterium]